MLKRKLYEKLVEWKNDEFRKPMIIDGARQVGKTFLVETFGQKEYENFVKIDFVKNREMKEIFEGELSTESIMAKLSLTPFAKKIKDKKTLLFLDEVQLCPKAIASLKYFKCSDALDIIVSGSLLGLIHGDDMISYPVGAVHHIEMFSLDFEEFLWAVGVDENVIEMLRQNFVEGKTVDKFIHDKMMNYFKQYIVIGGMPSVVNVFLRTNNYEKVIEEQRDIIKDYKIDIDKYAKGTDKEKIHECFDAIPKQLAKENKKFQYSVLEDGGSKRKFSGCLTWLKDAGIIKMCHLLSNPELPFEGNSKEEVFKVYMHDTGLLIAMLEDGAARDIMNGNMLIYKGAIYENIVAEMLYKNKFNLYYFEYKNSLEIDFFIRYNNLATAIEVKSSENAKARSLKSMIENWGVKQAIKLSTQNVNITNNVISVPLYMSMFLKTDAIN